MPFFSLIFKSQHSPSFHPVAPPSLVLTFALGTLNCNIHHAKWSNFIFLSFPGVEEEEFYEEVGVLA